jgi:hypothetical protein
MRVRRFTPTVIDEDGAAVAILVLRALAAA